MQIRRDNYNLGKSNKLEVFSDNLDIKADVILTSNEKEVKINATISGRIVDTLNKPIKNALIKLINDNLDPLANTRTDEDGKYVVNTIPSSTKYAILATAIGKIVNQSPSFTIKTNENKIINFTLSNDPNAVFSAISGTLSSINNNAIKGAIITLYKINENNTDLFAITYSDLQGTFLFSELLPGKYKILIQSITNISYEEIIIVESSIIYNFSKTLNLNSNLRDGSISGTITDNLGNIISKADVILYKVENNIKIPMAFTQTNNFGLYSFANVPFGAYLVKSNATQSLDFNMVVSPSVKITSTTELGTYNFSTGILENGAMVDYDIGVVTSLGGQKGGVVTLSVNVEKYGLYDFAIYYLAADFNRPLKISINEKELDETYKLPITPGWTIEDTKIFYISATLNEGINILKFYGDGVNLAPNLKVLTLIFNETENSPMFTNTFATSDGSYFKSIAIEGTYSNGAKYNNQTLLTSGIGGSTDGAVTIQIYVRDTALYYMTIKYMAKAPNLNLKVDINNIIEKKIYTLPQTDSSISKSFILPIPLNRGNNIIKFHGDGKTLAPDLDSFILNLPPLTQNLTEGTLENGSTVDKNKNIVLGIGGVKNGSVTVSINVAIYGYYKLLLDYISTTGPLPLKIDINSINTSTILYSLPKTKSSNINDKKSFEFIVRLNSGNNTLRFSGNGKDLAPNLISFITSFYMHYFDNLPVIQDVYNINSVKLGGSATLDTKTNLITSLGGKNKGYFTLNVDIKYTGEYILRIVYRNNRKFKIDINGKWNGKIYTTIGGLRDIYSIPIILDNKKNTLKFYGNGDELAPDIGDIYVDFNYPITKRIEDGLFLNGSNFISEGNIISPIGGTDNSSYTLYYFAPEYAEYNLNLILSTEDRSLLININDINTETIYNIPSSKTVTVPYAINVVLNYGDNFIQFYGNGSDYAPDIYNIDIKPVFSDVSKFTYNLADAVLKNGVTIDLNKNFVQNIGAKNKGSAMLTIKIDTEDYYDFNIQYIPLSQDSPLRLNVNNKAIKETFYLPLLESSYHNTSKIFIIPKVFLNKGNNTIEFYGNGIDPVAKIGKIRVSKFKETATLPDGIYYAINGKFENGAKKATFSPNFVDGIGGVNQDGSVTIKANTEIEGFYNLLVEYLLDKDNNPLLIDINGNSTGNLYMLPKTKALREEDAKYFVVPVVLKKGDNTIKFHGDTSIGAPSIGKIYINKSPQITTYNFFNAELNQCKIIDYPENFIYFIETVDESWASIKVNIDTEGVYYLTIKYLSKIISYIDIKLNNTPIQNKVSFPATKSENTGDAKALTIKVNFTSGVNILTFGKVKDRKFPSPLLGSFTISKNILIQTFLMEKALLLKGATFNKQTKFIEGLGGVGNGYAIINVKVLQSGLYDMNLSYLSLKVDRKLKVTINNVPMKKTFLLPINEDSSKIFTIPITLRYGMNSIKLQGDRSMREGPMINELTLSLNTTNPIKHYNLVDGTVTGGAVIDKINNIVKNIGGEKDGTVTMKVNVISSNIYDLEVWYSNTFTAFARLSISVNDEVKLNNEILPFSFDDNKVYVKIWLNVGDNFIKFYGGASNKEFVLYDFTLTVNNNSLINLNNTNYLLLNLPSGQLLNGASVTKDGNFVTNIGGKKGGIVTLKVSVNYAGEYSLIVDYIEKISKNSKFNCIVLEVNYNILPNISIITVNQYAKNIIHKEEFILNLRKGNNTISFRANGSIPVPDLGSATLTLKCKSK